jgi:hypothetical protein
MTMRRAVTAAALLGLPLACVACPAKSETLFVEEPCSNGVRWPGGTNFPYEADGPTNAPACTPHCGPNAPSATHALTSAALPAGPCANAGNTCTMMAEWLGPCAPGNVASGPLDLFICRCTDATWVCTVDSTAPSATAWSCQAPVEGGAPDGG